MRRQLESKFLIRMNWLLYGRAVIYVSSAQMWRAQGWDPLRVSEAMEEAGEQPEAAKCRWPGQAPGMEIWFLDCSASCFLKVTIIHLLLFGFLDRNRIFWSLLMKCTQRPRRTSIKSRDFWHKASDWKQVLCSHSPFEKRSDFMSDLPISGSLAAFSFVLPPSSTIFLSQGIILICGFWVSGPGWESQWWCCCFWEEHTLRAQALSLCGVSRALGRLQAWLQTNPRVWFWGLGDLLSASVSSGWPKVVNIEEQTVPCLTALPSEKL